MSAGPGLPRLVFGPRDRGRGHDLLASSPGAPLDAGLVSQLRDYNLRIGDYVIDDAPIYAFFLIAEGLWAAAATRRHSAEGGNTVWTTSVVLVDQVALAQVEDLMGLFAAWEDAQPPPAGAEIEGWRTARAARAQPTAVAGALRKISWPLAIEVAEPLVVADVLRDLTRTFLQWERERVAFITAPAPLKPWSLVLYRAEAWAAAGLGAEYEVVRLDGGGLEAPRAARADRTAWRDLLDGLERDARSGALASRMDRAVGELTPGGAPSASALVSYRARLWIQAQATIDDGRLALFALYKAAATIVDRASRRAVMEGLHAAFEALVLGSDEPQRWISAHFELLQTASRHEPPPPFLVSRLILQSQSWFALDDASARAAAPALLTGAGDALRAMLMKAPLAPERDALLLGSTLDLIGKAEAAEAGGLWRVATVLIRRLSAAPASPGPDAALTAAFELAERQGALWTLPVFLSMRGLPRLAGAMGRAPLRSRLIPPVRRASTAMRAGARRPVARDLLLSALVLHRAGLSLGASPR